MSENQDSPGPSGDRRGGGARWLVRLRGPDEPTGHLVCVPHAGGWAQEFRRWTDAMPGVQLWGVQLPGRGWRASEPPPTRLLDAAEALAANIDVPRPYAIFGHSLGALLAFETARAIERRGGPGPELLCVSGAVAPHLVERTEQPLSEASTEDLLATVAHLNGLPAGLSEDSPVLRLILPGLRADLRMFETYDFRPGAPLRAPIHAICGDADAVAPVDRVPDWRRHTSAGFAVTELPGGHDFIWSRPEAVAAAVGDRLGGRRDGAGLGLAQHAEPLAERG